MNLQFLILGLAYEYLTEIAIIVLLLVESVYLYRTARDEESSMDREEKITKELSSNSITLAGITFTGISLLVTLGDSALYNHSLIHLGISFAFFSVAYQLSDFVLVNWRIRIIQDKFHKYGFLSLVIAGTYLFIEESIVGSFFVYIALVIVAISVIAQYSIEVKAYIS